MCVGTAKIPTSDAALNVPKLCKLLNLLQLYRKSLGNLDYYYGINEIYLFVSIIVHRQTIFGISACAYAFVYECYFIGALPFV